MDHGEIIDQQITLLAKLNEQLADRVTPEATQEIRENIKAIIDLVKIRVGSDLKLAGIENRLQVVEKCLFGDRGAKASMEYYYTDRTYTPQPLVAETRDQADYQDEFREWMQAIEKHLDWSPDNEEA